MKKLIVSKRPLDQKEMAGEAVSVPDWWKGLTRNQRQHYLDKHKKSKLLDKLNVNDERVPRQKKAPEDKSVNVAPKENAPVTKETPAPKEQAPAIKKLENVQTENKAFKSADNKEKIKEIKDNIEHVQETIADYNKSVDKAKTTGNLKRVSALKSKIASSEGALKALNRMLSTELKKAGPQEPEPTHEELDNRESAEDDILDGFSTSFSSDDENNSGNTEEELEPEASEKPEEKTEEKPKEEKKQKEKELDEYDHKTLEELEAMSVKQASEPKNFDTLKESIEKYFSHIKPEDIKPKQKEVVKRWHAVLFHRIERRLEKKYALLKILRDTYEDYADIDPDADFNPKRRSAKQRVKDELGEEIRKLKEAVEKQQSRVGYSKDEATKLEKKFKKVVDPKLAKVQLEKTQVKADIKHYKKMLEISKKHLKSMKKNDVKLKRLHKQKEKIDDIKNDIRALKKQYADLSEKESDLRDDDYDTHDDFYNNKQDISEDDTEDDTEKEDKYNFNSGRGRKQKFGKRSKHSGFGGKTAAQREKEKEEKKKKKHSFGHSEKKKHSKIGSFKRAAIKKPKEEK